MTTRALASQVTVTVGQPRPGNLQVLPGDFNEDYYNGPLQSAYPHVVGNDSSSNFPGVFAIGFTRRGD